MSAFYQIKKYIQYRLRAGNEHGLHSPYVYTLYTEVISNKNTYYAFEELDNIRKQLLQNNQTIEVLDLGAGSQKMNRNRKISEIAKYSIVSKKYGELLFRLINYFNPETILELGTSLGISSLYLSKAAPNAKITSIEGCPNTFSFANKLIESTGIKNIETINSSFDDAFKDNLLNKKFDVVYIDGNHTYEATINYFNLLLKNANENSVLIFDDIYWTPQMTMAWEDIKKHAAITITIDLYKVGLVFFRKENKQKEHFCLKY
ncbi:MAG: class I SAM-dependent methyltransferase [Bacteroidia bacterium]